MDEKEQVQPVADEQVIEEPKVEKSIDDIKAEIEAKFKSEIAGLNRKISEYDKDKQARDLEAMDAEQKAAELEKRAAEAEERQRQFERKLTIDSALNEVGLPLDLYRDRVTGVTEDEIKEDVAKMKAFLDDLVKNRVEAETAQLLKGNPPTRQDNPQGKLSLDDIEKIPDRAERIKAYKANGFM